MMKKTLHLIPVLLCILLFTGCVETSTLSWVPAPEGSKSSKGNTAVWQLDAHNSGLFLFYWIPIYSGHSKWPNCRDYELWENHLADWHMKRLLNSELKRLHADRVEDIQITNRSTGAFGLWIFWMRSSHATGTAVKLEKQSKKTE